MLGGLRTILGIPIVDGILVPVIHLLLQVQHTRLLWFQPILFPRATNSHTKLDVLLSTIYHTKAVLATTLQHTAVVPAAQTHGAEASDDIGDDIKWVEGSVVGKEALDNLRANA